MVVVISTDGRKAYRADTIEQVDGWLSSLRACLQTVEPRGSAAMMLRADVDLLLDRRTELDRERRRDGFGLGARFTI